MEKKYESAMAILPMKKSFLRAIEYCILSMKVWPCKNISADFCTIHLPIPVTFQISFIHNHAEILANSEIEIKKQKNLQ